MAVEKTKHTFMDDNPYLVYSGEPESTLDNAGGGGGGDGDSGDSGVMYVHINDSLNHWDADFPGEFNTELTADYTVDEIRHAVEQERPVVVLVKLGQGSAWIYLNLIHAVYGESTPTMDIVFANYGYNNWEEPKAQSKGCLVGVALSDYSTNIRGAVI